MIRWNEMYCFSGRENLYWFLVSVRTARKYIFLPHINAIIRRCIEAGLFQKWQEDSSLYHTGSSRKEDRRVILTVAHIGGGLLTLFCGIFLALLTFIGECVAFHKTMRENPSKFWIILSKVVDGRRFYFRADSQNREVRGNVVVHDREHRARLHRRSNFKRAPGIHLY